MSNNRYVNIFVLDSSGRIIFSVYEQDNDINEVTLQGSRNVFESAEIKVIDFYFCEVHKEVHLEIIAPVFDNNEVVATMVFMVNPLDNIFALVQQWPGSGKTAESMIVRERGDSVEIVNELRFVQGSSLQYRFPLSKTENPAVMPFVGYTGMQQGIDYSGERVLCDIVKVEGTDWYLIVKIDEGEIFSDLNKRGLLISIITILIIGMSVLTISWIYNNRQRNLYRKIADQQEEYKVITDNISDVVWIADLNLNIKYVSKSIEKMTGESVEEHLSKSLTEKLPPESISIAINALEAELTKEREQGIDKFRNQIFEVQHYHADGHLIWLGMNVSFLRDASGNITGVLGVSRDITNIKETEFKLKDKVDELEKAKRATIKLIEDLSREMEAKEKLEKEKFRLLDIIEKSVNEIYLLNSKSYKIEYANRGALLNIGYSIEEMQKLVPYDFTSISSKDEFEKLIEPLVKGKTRQLFFESHHIRKDGSIYPIEVTLQIIMQEQESLFLAIINDITEIHSAREKLKTSDRIFTHSIDMLSIIGIDGTFMVLNPSWKKILGWSIQELQKVPVVNFIHPDDLSCTKEALLSLSKGVALQQFQVRFRCRDGMYKWLSWNAFPYVTEGVIFLVSRDITESRAAEDALKESEERYRLVLNNSLDAVMLTKPDTGEIVSANKAACEMFEMTEEEILKVGRNGIIDLSDSRLSGYLKIREEKGKIKGELNFVRSGGRVFPAEFSSSVFYSKSGSKYSTMIVRSIEERKLSEKALNESQLRYQELIDGMSETVWVISLEGKLLDVNRAATLQLGYTKEELFDLGLDGIDSALSSEEIGSLVESVPEDKLHIFETVHKTKDGSKIPVEIYSSIVNYKGKKAIMSIARDVTLLKKMEDELRYREETIRLLFDSTAEGIYGIDLEGKCTFCNSSALKILGYTTEEEVIGEDMHFLIHHTDINGVEYPIEFCPIHRAILDGKGTHSESDVLWRKDGSRFISEYWSYPIIRDNSAFIIADKFKIDAVITNLLSNAIKFTKEGVVEFGNFVKENKLFFYVKDTGIGIPLNKQSDVFNRFVQVDSNYSRPHEGSGLGLAIVKGYIEAMGGEIWIESEPEKYTKFIFYIPYIISGS